MADNLPRLIKWFETAEQASQTARAEAEQARDYYDGKQLSEEVRKALRKRKQPETWTNLIQRKVDYLCGLERQSRTDPKAWPRTAQHEQDAEAITDALRYVKADQNVDVKRSKVFQHMLVEGLGAAEVIVTRGRKGVIDPKVVDIDWDRVFFDPHSSKLDFSDAQYLGYVTWMDAAEAKAKWPEQKALIDQTVEKPTSSLADTYDDKPKWSYWADKARNRIRVVTCYYLEGDVWQRVVYTLAGELEPCGPSPWQDEDGKPECGLILQAAYRDRDNDPYGIVRNMIPIQDAVNKRESKALHLLTMRQVRVSPGAGMKANEIRAELARPDGVILAESGEVEVLNNQDMTAGHFQLLQEAKANLAAMGPNAAMQGKGNEDGSGRAILALQQGGMVEMAPLMDGLRHFTIRMYRQIFNRIRQFWTEERWVRVTDDEQNVRFVALNTTKGTLAMQKLADAVKAEEVPMEVARQYEQQIATDPSMGEPANLVAELDVDIDIDEVQETPSLQIEQFQTLTSMVQAGIPIPPEVLIEASNLRNKSKLLEMLKQAKEGQSQPNPMQQLQMAGEEAKVEKTRAEAVLTGAKAQNEMIRPQMDAMAAMSQPQPMGPMAA